MSTHTLVVEWQIPDDAPNQAAQDAIVTLAHKIHTLVPAPAEQVTAYTGVAAAVIAEAARVGAVVAQADRLAVQPGDVVTVRLDREVADVTEEVFAAYCEALQTAFPDNKIVVLERETTITASPADEGGAS